MGWDDTFYGVMESGDLHLVLNVNATCKTYLDVLEGRVIVQRTYDAKYECEV
jgi:hypothetical protein